MANGDYTPTRINLTGVGVPLSLGNLKGFFYTIASTAYASPMQLVETTSGGKIGLGFKIRGIIPCGGTSLGGVVIPDTTDPSKFKVFGTVAAATETAAGDSMGTATFLILTDSA